MAAVVPGGDYTAGHSVSSAGTINVPPMEILALITIALAMLLISSLIESVITAILNEIVQSGKLFDYWTTTKYHYLHVYQKIIQKVRTGLERMKNGNGSSVNVKHTLDSSNTPHKNLTTVAEPKTLTTPPISIPIPIPIPPSTPTTEPHHHALCTTLLVFAADPLILYRALDKVASSDSFDRAQHITAECLGDGKTLLSENEWDDEDLMMHALESVDASLLVLRESFLAEDEDEEGDERKISALGAGVGVGA